MRFDEFKFQRMMLFATAAVDVLSGGGGDAGGSGGDSGGVGGIGESGVESGDSPVVSPEHQVGDDATPGGDTGQLTTDPAEVAGDGRLIPQKYRELFKQDKELKGLWFANQAFKKEFPGGLNEARQLREFHAEVGGPDGVEQLRAVAGELDQIDAQLASGDPKLIENIVAQHPESLTKLLNSGLEQWSKSSPEDYQHTMARVMVNTLNQSGAVNILNQLQQAIASKNTDQAAQLFDKFADWYSGIEGIAAKQPERKIDPEREKLAADQKAWNEQKTRDFQGAVATDVKSHYNAGFETELAKEFKARGLDLAKIKQSDPDSFGILIGQCDQQLGRLLAADKVFVTQYQNILKSMDKNKAVQFAKAKIDRVLPEVVQKTYKAFNRLGGGPAPKAQIPNPQPNNQPQQVIRGTKPPAQEQIDWQRTKPGEVLDGKAFLKGRKEQYVWDA